MKNENNPKISLRIRPLLYSVAAVLAVLVLFGGCRPAEKPPGPAALSFKMRILANLDLFSPTLSKNIRKHNRSALLSTLDKFHGQLNVSEEGQHFFLAILDNHGVTIASRAQTAVNGAQNYGNYRIVSTVLQKKRISQSSLYLQGGGKVYIICAPLLDDANLSGVVIIGIDSDYLSKSGISERDFMSLDFRSRDNGAR
ncbi:MAG TPA: hypothetical protein PLI53_03095 [Geobacteraceae bacterium]|nr:hypothetical protein [Geobacteraceae bacterium]